MKDIDVRRALLRDMRSMHSGDANTRIVEELGVCQGVARVDVAVLNGTVHGYEIKSERDTLTRLSSQAEIYNQALEYVSIVAAAHHLSKIETEDLIPWWWGIWIAVQEGSEVKLRLVREAQRNPSLEALALAQFLWRDEALAILSERGIAAGLSGKSRHHVWLRLTGTIPLNELCDLVRSRLKRRGGSWRAPGPQESSDGSRQPFST